MSVNTKSIQLTLKLKEELASQPHDDPETTYCDLLSIYAIQ